MTQKQSNRNVPGARQCYWISPVQDAEATGGYVPSLVTENEAGHQPLMGRGECAAPWVWGKTLSEAEAICDEQNAKRGLTTKDVFMITASSMRMGNLPQLERDAAELVKVKADMLTLALEYARMHTAVAHLADFCTDPDPVCNYGQTRRLRWFTDQHYTMVAHAKKVLADTGGK